MRSLLLPVDYQLTHDNGVISRLSQTTRPPLVRRDCRRVQDELLRVLVVRCRRLQPADEGAVSKLRLGVSADDFEVPGTAEPLALLLRSGLLTQLRVNT